MNINNEIPDWLLDNNKSETISDKDIIKKRKMNFVEKTIKDISSLLTNMVFSEEIALKRGLLQRLDPRTKIITIFMMVICTTLINNPLVLAVIYLLSFAAAKLSKIPLKFYFKRVWMIVIIFTGVMILPSIFNYVRPGTSLITLIDFGQKLHIGTFVFPQKLSITRQGLYGGILLMLRVGTAISIVTLMTITTRWSNLLKAFRFFFVPKIFVMTMEMCYRYIFIMTAVTLDMFDARKSRTVGRIDSKQGRKFVSNSIGVLFGKSYSLSEEIHDAMLARGYNGEPVILKEFQFTLVDFQWILLLGIIILTAFGGEILIG